MNEIRPGILTVAVNGIGLVCGILLALLSLAILWVGFWIAKAAWFDFFDTGDYSRSIEINGLILKTPVVLGILGMLGFGLLTVAFILITRCLVRRNPAPPGQ